VIPEPITHNIVDEIKSFYTHHEKYLIHYFPGMLPDNIVHMLHASGFSVTGRRTI
jgi:hypothetical protein